jgi:hypothetical protein
MYIAEAFAQSWVGSHMEVLLTMEPVDMRFITGNGSGGDGCFQFKWWWRVKKN